MSCCESSAVVMCTQSARKQGQNASRVAAAAAACNTRRGAIMPL